MSSLGSVSLVFLPFPSLLSFLAIVMTRDKTCLAIEHLVEVLLKAAPVVELTLCIAYWGPYNTVCSVCLEPFSLVAQISEGSEVLKVLTLAYSAGCSTDTSVLAHT